MLQRKNNNKSSWVSPLSISIMTLALFTVVSSRRSSGAFFARAFTFTATTSSRTATSTSAAVRWAPSFQQQRRFPEQQATSSITITSATSAAAAATCPRRARAFTSTRMVRQQGTATTSVEEELDAALDGLLGEVFLEAENPIRPPGGTEAGRHMKNSRPMPPTLVEQDPMDFNDPKLLSTSNPRWINNGMDPAIIDILSNKGITQFTPVQAEAFDPVLAGRHVIGRSRTGTGKTLAFGIPGLLRLVKLTEEKGTRDASGRMTRGRSVSMIVLCPTRELARQVSEELSIMAQPLGLFVSLFHGGVSYDPQARDLRQGIDVLVGTPGRIIDHLERGNLKLSHCDLVVLDEADEMLNMGFADDVETILEGVGAANVRKTQCLLFSATTPPWVKTIGRRYQEDVLAIDSTGDEGGARVAKTVRHLAVQLPPGVDAKRAVLEDLIAVEISKDAHLKNLTNTNDDGLPVNKIAAAANARKKKSAHTIQQKIFGKTIVFVETKREADELVSGGVFKSLTAQALHGDVGQKQRDATLNAFRAGAFNVLVATDVAARGIDINDVDLVIQMDPPRDDDTYVHRSGRTGRAGKSGISVLLFNHHQSRDIVRIERGLGHGFKFDLVGPPSIEAALTAAAKTSAIACQTIPDETVQYFKETASEMLANGEDAEDVVARCLAAISRRANDVQSRSLITGELGVATVEMTNSEGRPVGLNDVMFTIGKLSRMSREDEDLAFDSDVGRIKTQDGGSAIFDMSVEDAKKLVQFSAGIDAGGAVFTLLKELEIERDRNFGQSDGRGYGGGGGGRGGGRSSGGGGRGGYSGYNDRRGDRVTSSYGGGGSYGGGSTRGVGRPPPFNSSFRGEGRPRPDGRRQDNGGSGGSRVGGWRDRYDSGKKSNDGW